MTALQEEQAQRERARRWHDTFNARVSALGAIYVYDADGNKDWTETNDFVHGVATEFADLIHGKLEP